MQKIYINLIGTDGSGKTSISERLTLKLGSECQMIWCGSESFLMKPIRFFLGLIAKSNKENKINKNYQKDIKRKRKIANRSPLLSAIYIWLILLDYGFQYKWKLFKIRKSKFIILDRYFFDVAVNLAIRLGWTNDELIVFLEKKIHKFHLPELRVWVKVSPETSMERKDDIPDISYIQIRMNFYQSIADRFGFIVIDGEESIDENADLLFNLIEEKKNSKSIMYVHSNNEDIGGADFCLFRLANEFEKKGYQVSCALRLSTNIIKEYRAAGIPVFSKYFSRPQLSRGLVSILMQPFKTVLDILYFSKLYAVQQPSIVHVNDLYDFAPAMAARLKRVPVIYHIRMIRENRLERYLFSHLVDFLSYRSVSVSTPVRDHYFNMSHFSDEKHLVVHDWPNDELVDSTQASNFPSKMHKSALNIVMIGRLEHWKGQHIFLNAIESLNKEHQIDNVFFYIIGGIVQGDSKEQYSNDILYRVKKLKNVIYLGERKDVPDILKSADISIHASVTPDPFPGVALESLLSGAATIGARAGGLTEMIRDGVDGFLFEPGNYSDLSQKIIQLIKSKQLRDDLSKSGRERILNMTNKKRLLHKFELIYIGEL